MGTELVDPDELAPIAKYRGNKRKLKIRERILSQPSKAYNPSPSLWAGYASNVLDGTPVFTWLDVPRMMRDPQIQFGLRMLRSPFSQAKWKVRADSQALADYVDNTLKRFWRRIVPKLLLRYFCWGFSAAVIDYRIDRKRIRFATGKVIEPRDVVPLVWRQGRDVGDFAGLRITQSNFDLVEQNGVRVIDRPNAFWFSGHEELGRFYDRPRLAGAFEPWLEKNGRTGAKHSRRLWYRKCAFDGGTLYYPPGPINVGTENEPIIRDGADIAREQLDYYENGSGMTFPNNRDSSGNRMWEFDPPKSRPDAAGVLEYPKELDREILVGMGIPNEVLEAASTGSGWSGRMIPAMAYFGSADEVVTMLIDQFDEQCMRPIVIQNFGSNARYEIEPTPLSETLLGSGQPGAQTPPTPGAGMGGGDAGGMGVPGGGGGDAHNPLLAGGPGGGGGSGGGSGSRWKPYLGPRGGHGKIDPVTGRRRYGHNLSLEGDGEGDLVITPDQIHALGDVIVKAIGEAKPEPLSLASSDAGSGVVVNPLMPSSDDAPRIREGDIDSLEAIISSL